MGKGKQNLIQMQRSLKARLDLATSSAVAGEGEGEVAFFSAKRWDRRNRADLIESATPCHHAQVVGPELQKVVDLPPNLKFMLSTFLMSTQYTIPGKQLHCVL